MIPLLFVPIGVVAVLVIPPLAFWLLPDSLFTADALKYYDDVEFLKWREGME